MEERISIMLTTLVIIQGLVPSRQQLFWQSLSIYKYIDEFNERWRKISEIYNKELERIEGIVLPITHNLSPKYQYLPCLSSIYSESNKWQKGLTAGIS